VHFYAVSATALVCAAVAVVLGTVGIRRNDRRAAAIGAGFTVIAALLAVHGLSTPGFLIDSEYTAAVGVAGALAVPLGGAVILVTLLARPRQRGHVRDLVYLQAGVLAGTLVFGAVALFAPAVIPSVPVALRPLVWWIVGVNAAIYGVLALRALRTFQLTRRLGDLAVVAGLVWLAIAVATYLLSPLWSIGFWSGHVLELGAFAVIAIALGQRPRARDAVAIAALRYRRPHRRHQRGGAARRLGRAPARAACRQGHLDARAHAPCGRSRRPGRAGARPARRAPARACGRRPAA
jgi:hypothetical protein